MASGTITSIKENGLLLTFTVDVAGAMYKVITSKAIFDALVTNLDKQNYIIQVLTNIRRTSREYENIYPAVIGAVIIIPD